jgi:hypothetical protein
MSENVNEVATETVAEPVIVDLRMTVDQVNFVLNLLSQLPYKDSAPLINSIRNQAVPQLQAPQQAAEQTEALQ